MESAIGAQQGHLDACHARSMHLSVSSGCNSKQWRNSCFRWLLTSTLRGVAQPSQANGWQCEFFVWSIVTADENCWDTKKTRNRLQEERFWWESDKSQNRKAHSALCFAARKRHLKPVSTRMRSSYLQQRIWMDRSKTKNCGVEFSCDCCAMVCFAHVGHSGYSSSWYLAMMTSFCRFMCSVKNAFQRVYFQSVKINSWPKFLSKLCRATLAHVE